MSFPVYLVGSEEYVQARVEADVTLGAQTVVIVIDGTDYPAQWVGASGTTRNCQTTDPIDFSGWLDNLYQMVVTFTDSPEIPATHAGWIRVRAVPVPAGP